MMRIDRTLLLLAVGLLLGWGIGATDDPVKVGFVDVEQVLATVDSGKAAREELERKSRDAQGRLAPLIEQLETMQKELQAKQFVMSEEAVREKQLDLVELKNRYETKAKEEEGQFKIDQQRLIGPLIEKLESVIKEVGRDNRFSVILRIDAPSLVYAREALDITDLIVKTFNGKG
jgi:outer membrane protein